MKHEFDYPTLQSLAMVTLSESGVDLNTDDIAGAIRSALEGTAPEVIYTCDCYAVCADANLYSMLDMGDVEDTVGGFADCSNADKVVYKESNVVVDMVYNKIAGDLADKVKELASQMEGTSVGEGHYVDIASLRMVRDTNLKESIFSCDAEHHISTFGDSYIYGLIRIHTGPNEYEDLVLMADIEDEDND